MSSTPRRKRRMETDVIKLIESKYDVNILSGIDIFTVKFPGPKDTSYEGGTWKIRVFLPEKYPFQAPKIGFVNKVFHPNIDEASGVICLNVIDESWSALYDLSNIFESFLPQLLAYPNPKDPLNVEAATLLLRSPTEYRRRVQEYIRRYAIRESDNTREHSPASDESLSDLSEDDTDA